MSIINGVYVENRQKPYEVESLYYLNFHILSALVSLDHLAKYRNNFSWENKCQYYHFYTDHLLFSIGQIANRFIIRKSDSTEIRILKKQEMDYFCFTKEYFPLLSDKRARNVIEHIDEYNSRVIDSFYGVGGFNLIDYETDETVVDTLRSRKNTHTYTLDLLQRELLIRYKDIDITIKLDDIKIELLTLQEKVRELISTIKSF